MESTLTVNTRKRLADLTTPVGLYLKIRDLSYNAFLLESSDYHGEQDSYSFICLNPLSEVMVLNGNFRTFYKGRKESEYKPENITEALNDYMQQFNTEGDFPHALNGFFGYFGYDSVAYFENIEIPETDTQIENVPEIRFTLFRHIIAINHFKNETTLIENVPDNESSQMDFLEGLLTNKNFTTYPFESQKEIDSPITDSQYEEMVTRAKEHCQRGDSYQLVLSRRFSQSFMGDEFNVYRALRSINPSPYLFYFDYGSYKIFGSSPESQLQVDNHTAIINPIAGTFQRSGDDEKDKEVAGNLKEDPKENAEHVMLVDLARNDLSKSCSNVEVETFKEVQYFSHVIHLVSKVKGDLSAGFNPVKVLADNFPAGTLSGAPKYKAMELIREYEPHNRGVYGGAIGKIGFDGNVNMAIIIRTFLSKGNKLYFQAGAGIVNQSQEDKEREEVDNKLMALHKAIKMANEL